MKKKSKKSVSFLKDEENKKEKQLYEALQNRAILEPLDDEGLSLPELKYKVSQSKKTEIPKSTIATRISRLKTAGLVRKQTKTIRPDEAHSPQYRGWRLTPQKNGTYQAKLGYELTENGKSALETIRTFTEPKSDLPQKKRKKQKEKEGGGENRE